MIETILSLELTLSCRAVTAGHLKVFRALWMYCFNRVPEIKQDTRNLNTLRYANPDSARTGDYHDLTLRFGAETGDKPGDLGLKPGDFAYDLPCKKVGFAFGKQVL